MRVFAHPLRIDNDGAIATVDQGSLVQAQQLAIAIVSTHLGERALAPDFGIFDPVAVGTSRAEIAAAGDVHNDQRDGLLHTLRQDGTRQHRYQSDEHWHRKWGVPVHPALYRSLVPTASGGVWSG